MLRIRKDLYTKLTPRVNRFPWAAILALIFAVIASTGQSTLFSQDRDSLEQTKVMLQDLADRSKQIKLATEFTELIAQCEPLLARQLTPRQRDYVESVAAWAHGRRGELRLETAEQLQLAGNAQSKEVLQTAIDDLSIAIAADLKRWRLFLLRGIAYTHQTNWKLAAEDFGQAIELKPEDVKTWYNRGLAYLQQQQWEAALTDLDTAINLAPNDLEILTSRGHALLGCQQFDLALTDFQHVAKALPENPAVLVNLADALLGLKQWPQAIEQLEQAIQQQQQTELEAVAWQRLAWIKATCPDGSIRDLTAAQAAIDKAIQLANESRSNLETLAVIQMAQGNIEQAKQTADRSKLQSGSSIIGVIQATHLSEDMQKDFPFILTQHQEPVTDANQDAGTDGKR